MQRIRTPEIGCGKQLLMFPYINCICEGICSQMNKQVVAHTKRIRMKAIIQCNQKQMKAIAAIDNVESNMIQGKVGRCSFVMHSVCHHKFVEDGV